ncbi:MAG: ATP-dependent helicase HrpB, partial [Bacteroidales bacterium]|nr:ATP-dependent helicase HrpB [Bacteroidales bacterium]
MEIKIQKGMDLPVAAVSDEVSKKLASSSCLVLTAPPGAGKSTLLPLLIANSFEGRILMLEPRRLAARQIAERMASMIGEPVGKTVGYRIRFESKVSSETRIEVLTEGILTRMLVSDPFLEGVSVVIFDEYHERNLASDVALALTRESQAVVRPELKILVMSATIDTASICSALGASLVESDGRMFPVENLYTNDTTDGFNVAEKVSHSVRIALRENDGDVLAFLPGEAEIRKCAELLEGAGGENTRIMPLYGMLAQKEQQEAIAPSRPGERKVVLATPVAETSLTIEGVRTVVDSGLCKKMVHDQMSGLSHLETVRISKDMAAQRSGRAGRVSEGRCYRLWSKGSEVLMAENRVPEILEADLAPMVLDIAAWGGSDPMDLPWLTPPPALHIAQASSLLKELGALDDNGVITPHGRKLAALPCHPRIAQMLVHAGSNASKALAADIAALLEEKDPMSGSDSDICTRIEELRAVRARHGGGRAWTRIIKVAEQYRSMVKASEDNGSADQHEIGALIAAAYPERIGKAHTDGCGKYTLSSGELASIEISDSLNAHEWIAVASMNARPGGVGRIFLAAPLEPSDIRNMMRERDNVRWDTRKGAVVAQHELRLGNLLVESKTISDGFRDAAVKIICEAAPKEGLSMFDFSDKVQDMQRRIATVSQWHSELELPDMSTEALLERGSEWIPLFIGKATSAAELKKMDLCEVIWSLLDYDQQQAVDRIAPSHIEVPTGSKIRVEYRQGAEA